MDQAEEREALNRIVHPAVEHRRRALLAEARSRGDRIVVSDIPLLFETMDPGAFDAIVLVDAPEEVRLQRLMAQRGLGEDEARGMIAAQMPAREKRDRSDFVIDNTDDLAALERATERVWHALRSRA